MYGLLLQLGTLSSTSGHLDTAASYLTDYSLLAASIQRDLAWVDGVMQRLDVTTCNATAHRLSSGVPRHLRRTRLATKAIWRMLVSSIACATLLRS